MSKEVKKSVTEFAIVRAIMSVLNLDDAGRIQTFFAKEVKNLKRAISKLEANLKAEKLQYDNNVDDHMDAIEDAREAVEAAYKAVTPEDVSNNAAMADFSDEYWYGIETAESSLTRLEKALEEYQKSYKETTDATKEQIEKYKTRISKLVDFKS